MPENVVDRLLERLEVPRSGVRLVTDQLAGELVLGDGAHAQRAHVEVDLMRRQVEHVEVRVREVFLPLLEGGKREESYGLDLMRLGEPSSGRHRLLRVDPGGST